MNDKDTSTFLDRPQLEKQIDSVSTDDTVPSFVGIRDGNNSLVKKKQENILPQQRNSFIEQKRVLMAPFICTVVFGCFYNFTFQSFVKEQLMDQMQMTNFMYQMFLLIPNIPNIPISLVFGPILDTVGSRLGLIIFTFLATISMAMCMIAVQIQSFPLILSGKVLFSISIDIQQTSISCLIGKWYSDKGLATVFTLSSLVCKIASSSAGILYPKLYETSGGLFLPLLIGVIACFVSSLSCIVVFILDRLAQKHQIKQISEQQIQQQDKYKFKLSDIKKFYKMFWLYVLLSPLTYGGFSAFQNYLQSVLTHKFQIDQTFAGQMISVPYWIAYTVPLFGLFADKFGKRVFMMIVLSFLSFVSVFTLYLLPSGNYIIWVWVSLVIFGLFLSLICAFLQPTIPFITQKNLLNTAFAISNTSVSLLISLMSYMGGLLMKDDNSGSDHYLLTYSIIFFVSFSVSIFTYFFDRKNGGIINSKTPQRYLKMQNEEETIKNIQSEDNLIQQKLINPDKTQTN